MDTVRVEATGPLVIVTLVLENTEAMLTPVGFFAWRLMVPVKPLRPIRVIADVPFVPVWTDTEVGVALAPKSGTGTSTVIVKL